MKIAETQKFVVSLSATDNVPINMYIDIHQVNHGKCWYSTISDICHNLYRESTNFHQFLYNHQFIPFPAVAAYLLCLMITANNFIALYGILKVCTHRVYKKFHKFRIFNENTAKWYFLGSGSIWSQLRFG